MDDAVVDAFREGVDAYWAGELVHGWDNPEKRERSPYVMGWYMASVFETQPGFLVDSYGEELESGY